MVAVRLDGVITDDHKLIIELPKTLPAGRVEVVIHMQPQGSATITNPAREAARAKLAAGGLLSNVHRAPINTRRPTETEVNAAGQLPEGARSSEDLIDEDRDER